MDFHFAYRPRISLDSGVISFFFYFFSYLLFLSLKKTRKLHLKNAKAIT